MPQPVKNIKIRTRKERYHNHEPHTLFPISLLSIFCFLRLFALPVSFAFVVTVAFFFRDFL
jgi:hypothetical protein